MTYIKVNQLLEYREGTNLCYINTMQITSIQPSETFANGSFIALTGGDRELYSNRRVARANNEND